MDATNRSWHKVNEFHHPVLWKIKKHIVELHDVSKPYKTCSFLNQPVFIFTH